MKKIFSKFKNKKPYLIVGLISMMVCALIGGAYGYYVHNKDDDGYVVASNFFFESDYLSEKGEEYILNTNTTQITFKLKNYADELRCSENDINFVVTSDGATLSIDNGTLEKGKKSTTEITLSNLEKGKTYNISATGTSGYTRTLKAKFVVRDQDIDFYKNIDTSHNNYVEITIWSKYVSGNATLIFPEGVIPDNTVEGMENILTSQGKFNFEVETYSSYVYRFFKGGNYDENKEFSIFIEIDGVNVEATNQKI